MGKRMKGREVAWAQGRRKNTDLANIDEGNEVGVETIGEDMMGTTGEVSDVTGTEGHGHGHEKAIESLEDTGIGRDQGLGRESIQIEVKIEESTAVTDTETAAVTETTTGTEGGKNAMSGHGVAVESVRMTAAVRHMNEDDDEMIHDE